jgi:hypothetical protein
MCGEIIVDMNMYLCMRFSEEKCKQALLNHKGLYINMSTYTNLSSHLCEYVCR